MVDGKKKGFDLISPSPHTSYPRFPHPGVTQAPVIHEAARKWKKQLNVDLLINPQRSCLARLFSGSPPAAACGSVPGMQTVGHREGCSPFLLRPASKERVWSCRRRTVDRLFTEPADLVESGRYNLRVEIWRNLKRDPLCGSWAQSSSAF